MMSKQLCNNTQLRSDQQYLHLHNGVKDCQAKEQLVECALVGAAIKEVGAGEWV